MDEFNLIDEFNGIDRESLKFKNTCSALAEDVTKGRKTILEIVEHLGPYLIDKSTDKREFGTSILTLILEQLPNNLFTSAQLNFIGAFYSDRLKDNHQLIPTVLKGIIATIKFQHLPDGISSNILNSLFKNIPCQQQQQNDRYNIYLIFKILLEKKLHELQAMSYDFVYGVMSSIDGERDPKNLLFLFNWLPKFLCNVTLGHLTEEMFEVMACYFPVDFRAPLQDPNSVTRDDLANALCPCLCALSEFAQFCIPLALEKLNSSLTIAKLDSLNLLIEGCKTFSGQEYDKYSIEIWSTLQKELLNCENNALEIVYLNTLTAFIKKLSDSSTDNYKKTIEDIVDTLKGNLRPDGKLFISSSKILLHVMKASKQSSDFIIKNIMPMLLNICMITKTKTHQLILFNEIINFTKVYVEVQGNADLSEKEELKSVPALCLKMAVDNDEDFRSSGLISLSFLTTTLNKDIRYCVYENIKNLLILPQSDRVRIALINCFKAFSKNYSEEIKEKILNQLVINDLTSLHLYLNSLKAIVIQDNFMEFVLNTIITIVKEDDKEKSCIGLNCLSMVVNENEDNKMLLNNLHEKEIINKLITWILNNINSINDDEIILNNILIIFKSVIYNQDNFIQQKIIEMEIKRIMDFFNNTNNHVVIVLLNGLLLRIKQDVKIEQLNELLSIIKTITYKSNSIYYHNLGVQLLANIINKQPDGDLLKSYLNQLKNEYLNFDVNETFLLNVLIWIVKALIMRGHSNASDWKDKLIELLEKDEKVAKGFEIIMSDKYDCLSLKSCCNIRILYQQKFFIDVINSISEKLNIKNGNYLIAFGCLVKETPKNILLIHFQKIIRFIILCFDNCNDPEILYTLLDILCNLLENKETIMEEYIQEFIPRFLKLSAFKSSMKVRIVALRCLQHYTVGYPLYKLLPHKQNIVHKLTERLDDSKRLVRKEAVEARCRWYLLDAPV